MGIGEDRAESLSVTLPFSVGAYSGKRRPRRPVPSRSQPQLAGLAAILGHRGSRCPDGIGRAVPGQSRARYCDDYRNGYV